MPPKASEAVGLNSVQHSLCFYILLLSRWWTKTDIFHFNTDFKFFVWENKHSNLAEFIKHWYSTVYFTAATLALIFKMTPNRINGFNPIWEKKKNSKHEYNHLAVYIMFIRMSLEKH